MEDSTHQILALEPTGGAHRSLGTREAHRLQLRLCDALEAIADSLPSNVNTGIALLAAQYSVR